MAQYTSLTRSEIETISVKFSISNIYSYKILSGGSENTNYLISTENDKYVLTICEQKSAKKARELAHLLEHLEKHHFETSKIIRNMSNEPVTIWSGRPIMIKKFIDEILRLLVYAAGNNRSESQGKQEEGNDSRKVFYSGEFRIKYTGLSLT